MFFIDEDEDDEDYGAKRAREEERDRLRRMKNGLDKNPSEKKSWDIMTAGQSLYKIFASIGIVHATPEQLQSHEKRGIGKIT